MKRRDFAISAPTFFLLTYVPSQLGLCYAYSSAVQAWVWALEALHYWSVFVVLSDFLFYYFILYSENQLCLPTDYFSFIGSPMAPSSKWRTN